MMNSTWRERLSELGYAQLYADDAADAAVADRLIADLQSLTTQPMPPAYVDFVRAYPASGAFGAGVCHPTAHDGPVSLAYLIAGSADVNSDAGGLRRHQASMHGEMLPMEWLAVGQDLGGNQFALGLRRDRWGQVVFWDHREHRIVPLAPDFAAFLAGLRLQH